MIEVRLPEYEAECSAYLSFWYKQEGENVDAGEELLEIETDKAALMIEAPATGRLVQILVQEDEPVQTGQVVGLLEPTKD
jgi:pyruvate/2-oxoglutarate dehydrogenase complex dihydrolipoamide acyltransferase (E2) component